MTAPACVPLPYLRVALPVAANELLELDRLSDSVPPFRLQASCDRAPAIDLVQFTGRTVLLHFWASWCAPCRDELPLLQRLADTLDPVRFAVVLVAIDECATREEVTRFARDHGVTQPVYLARESAVNERYWSLGVPVTYLLDGQGGFVGRALGPRAWDTPATVEALRRFE